MRERDAEADSFGTDAVGRGDEVHFAARYDDQGVDLSTLVVGLDDRLALLRGRERGVQVRLEVVVGAEEEDAALSRRVRRLQHRRQAGGVEYGACLADVA